MQGRKEFSLLNFCTLSCTIIVRLVAYAFPFLVFQHCFQRMFNDLVDGFHMAVGLGMVGVEINLVIFHFRKQTYILRPLNCLSLSDTMACGRPYLQMMFIQMNLMTLPWSMVTIASIFAHFVKQSLATRVNFTLLGIVSSGPMMSITHFVNGQELRILWWAPQERLWLMGQKSGTNDTFLAYSTTSFFTVGQK